ncbi:hypothetical protein FHQ08_07865 [Lactobacillus sp. CC-MHH1034]|uniref:hypothetical protein n=1 Tax=Agrilactobacillus fermenti TaxID=2586909 RepID=UPI001E602819|nr:hypothetical protein [Agrilactobacillus fermenti]MCD2256635.1 hypothetical protein [Agrilactobacillus fermenti]
MKKSSVKYLGVAAAALLAVAPLAAPALSATTEPAQVQAAVNGLPQFVFGKDNKVTPQDSGYASLGNGAFQAVHATNTIYLGQTPATTVLNIDGTDKPYFSVQGAYFTVSGSQYGNGQFYVQAKDYWTKNYSISGNIQTDSAAVGDKPSVFEGPATPATGATATRLTNLLNAGSVTATAAYTDEAKNTYFAFTYAGKTYFVPEKDVTFAQGALVSDVTGTATTNDDDTPTYNDANAVDYTGTLVRDKGTKLSVSKVSKTSDGTVVAYFVENKSDNGNAAGKWVSANDVTFTATTPAKVTTKKLPAGTVVYSKNAATIYSDAATSKDSGKKLATDVTEWRAFEEALNDDGDVVAYRLGTNQWVKASDLALQKDKDGVFATAKGTTLYTSDGDVAGSIQADGVYKVYAERHINGKQALKLGTDSQWIYAENGAYYPA